MSGYIIHPRGLWKESLFANERFSEREAWLWIREHASYSDNSFRWRNHLCTVKRGQFAGTLLQLAQIFKWSRTKVKTFLEVLQEGQKIVRQKDTGFLLLTICDYDRNYTEENSERQQKDSRKTSSVTQEKHRKSTGKTYYTKETKETKETKDNNPQPPKGENFVLPDFIPEKDWEDYLKMREKIRRPATFRAKQLTVTKLEKLMAEGHPPSAVLQQSILGSYQGIFPVRQEEKTEGANTDDWMQEAKQKGYDYGTG